MNGALQSELIFCQGLSELSSVLIVILVYIFYCMKWPYLPSGDGGSDVEVRQLVNKAGLMW